MEGFKIIKAIRSNIWEFEEEYDKYPDILIINSDLYNDLLQEVKDSGKSIKYLIHIKRIIKSPNINYNGFVMIDENTEIIGCLEF